LTRRNVPQDTGPTLLDGAARQRREGLPQSPLADRLRPTQLEQVVGQAHLLSPGQPLAEAIAHDRFSSMILWGPPGSGKTTLARLLANKARTEFVPFSAVLGGLPELRELIAAAQERRSYQGRGTVLFVDEIHRFNKAQQDAFLPHVEAGTIILVGATTENPSFAVNAAVLSRCRVFRLEALGEADIMQLLRRALSDREVGLGRRELTASDEVLQAIAEYARGDARRGLSLLESATELLGADEHTLDVATVSRATDERMLLFDKKGDMHYDVVSAFIKSLRGSDPDAALYWMMRLLEAGDDPLFVLRRMIIFAGEDIGLADPRALSVAVDADFAFRRLGMPEGMYPIAEACIYLACAPKSNSVKNAWQAAQRAVKERGALPVPKKLRNGVTRLMQAEGHGQGYQYPHDYPGHFVPEEQYLPDALTGSRYYEPSDQGVERQVLERLQRLRARTREGDG
jgi:putative ATPase